MLRGLFKPKSNPAAALYAAIVAAARQPKFYAEWGVPDTVDGRFDMIVLHLYLVLARLRENAPELCQALTDTFCTDMDSNLREMGAGDLAWSHQGL
jgi:cytochrome b pre-mRNA-processing protein 3